MAKKPPRDIVRELLRLARQGPGSVCSPNPRDSAKEVRDGVRLWLDSWMVPALEELQRRAYPPTSYQLKHWLKQHQGDERDGYTLGQIVQKRIDLVRSEPLNVRRPFAVVRLEVIKALYFQIQDEEREKAKQKERRK
jgi:hypothetical protein